MAAVRGIVYSPHHMGDNDTGTKYDSLELIFRDAKHAELFAGYELEPETRPTGKRDGDLDRDMKRQLLAGTVDEELLKYAYGGTFDAS